MVIPPEMDIDLTQSTELAIKQALWEEYQVGEQVLFVETRFFLWFILTKERERVRKAEEDLTQKFLREEAKKVTSCV
jgi:hypothetical protein